MTHLTRDDYRSAGADESYSEGVVDHLRSVEGTAVAGLVRDQLAGEPARKVSLRATDDRIDVSRIARALRRRRASPRGRLLHRPRVPDELGSPGSLRAHATARATQLCELDGVLLVDKPAGRDVARRRRADPAAAAARA